MTYINCTCDDCMYHKEDNNCAAALFPTISNEDGKSPVCLDYKKRIKSGSLEEVKYRLQAMATMCIFQDACGHDLGPEEIKKYNSAKDTAINILNSFEKIQEEIMKIENDNDYEKGNSDFWAGFYTVTRIIEKYYRGLL